MLEKWALCTLVPGLICLLALGGCTRVSGIARVDATADGVGAPQDASEDRSDLAPADGGPRDLAPAQESSPDQATTLDIEQLPDTQLVPDHWSTPDIDSNLDSGQPDAAFPLPLVCSSASLAIENDTESAWEVAVTSDGLTLTAQGNNKTRLWSQRSSLSAPFSPWTSSGPFDSQYGDPSFFLHGGNEKVMLSVLTNGGGPRKMNICSLAPTFSCQLVTLLDSVTGNPITTDVDGQTVKVLAGQPTMLFDVSPTETDMTIANIYQAVAVNSNLTAWTAEPVEPLCSPSVEEDDPVISADGTTIIYGKRTSGAEPDLWVAYRSGTAPQFSQPVPLTSVNTTASEIAPELFELPSGQFELYFNSNRSGINQVYRASCTR